ncbi:Rv1733c family protein [Streptomyces sp. NPDC002643]
MVAFRGPRVWLWRWRRNPLRRRSDRLESWVVLATWALTLVGGVVAGLLAAESVESGLARQRAEWRPTAAMLTEDAPEPSSTSGPGAEKVWAKVRWTAPDGTERHGQARVDPATLMGAPVTVWTDTEGLLVTKPATESQARLRAGLVGGLAGLCVAAMPYVGGRLVRSRLERLRMDQWDEEWERIGPLWERKIW